MAQRSDLLYLAQLPAAQHQSPRLSHRRSRSAAIDEDHPDPRTAASPLETSIGEHFLKRGFGCCRRSGDEENLYGQTGSVPGFHLLLQQNPRMLAGGSRAAALLSSLSAFRASDDLNARSTRPRANAWASPVNPSVDPSRGDTGLGLDCSLGTRRTVNIEKLLQFVSSRWLKGG